MNNRSEKKKHYTQMSVSEIETVKNKIKMSLIDGGLLYFSRHCKEQISKKAKQDFDYKKATSQTMVEGKIIEYKIIQFPDSKIEERVVLRSKYLYNGKACCLVYSITNKSIVTIWFNSGLDNHKTLKISKYNANLEII